MPNRAVNAMVRFKLPNFEDTSVDNAGQGTPLVCLIVDNEVKKIEAGVAGKNNAICEFHYNFAGNEKVQIGLLSGNFLGGDGLKVVDEINEVNASATIEMSGINISWFHIQEY